MTATKLSSRRRRLPTQKARSGGINPTTWFRRTKSPWRVLTKLPALNCSSTWSYSANVALSWIRSLPFLLQESTVELRRSCDYCVRLKRACDGKSPCTLCSRRKKPCTRSARKKSGPAKGTKYAPRRKRSAIAEWADRASGAVAAVGGQRGASDLPPREAWALGPERSGEGGGHARMSPSLSPLLHAAPMSPSSFLGHRAMSASVGRGQSPQGLGGRGAPQHGRGSGFDPLSPSHSRRAGGITPFRSESFSKLEPGTGEAAAMRSSSAGVGGRRLAPQTELAGKSPPITGYQASPRPESPAAFSEQYRQEQHRRSESSAAATSWAAEGTSRSGLSRLEAEAAAEVEAVAASSGGGEAGYSVPPAGPDRGAPSSFLSHSGFPAIGAGRSDPRRAREPPVDWGRSSSPPRGMFASSPSGLSHGGRMRQVSVIFLIEPSFASFARVSLPLSVRTSKPRSFFESSCACSL